MQEGLFVLNQLVNQNLKVLFLVVYCLSLLTKQQFLFLGHAKHICHFLEFSNTNVTRLPLTIIAPPSTFPSGVFTVPCVCSDLSLRRSVCSARQDPLVRTGQPSGSVDSPTSLQPHHHSSLCQIILCWKCFPRINTSRTAGKIIPLCLWTNY